MNDRGPDSATVQALVQEESVRGAAALAGNHETMFLDFFDPPDLRDRLRAARSHYIGKGQLGCDPCRDGSGPPSGQEAVPCNEGHRDYGRLLRPDGLWAAHGHNMVDRAFAQAEGSHLIPALMPPGG